MAAAAEPWPGPPESLSWVESPYRNFGPPQALLSGSALLFDEAQDRELASSLSRELSRLFADLYGRDGFRVPFAEGQALRVYVARKEAGGIRRVAASRVESGRLVTPSVLLDGTGLGTEEIVREVGRQVAAATLRGYGASDPSFLTAAAAELLSADSMGEAELETARILAAAPSLELAAHPESLGRLWLEEVTRATGGRLFLRHVWERAAEEREEVLPVLLRAYVELTGEEPTAPLLRFAARLYSTQEAETSPSRVTLLDLEAGALDASFPASFALRHRTFLPAEHAAALRVAWPEDGAPAAAIVRYRDPELVPDVLSLSAGDVKRVPLSGVARIDWLVAGGGDGLSLVAPASFQPVSGPFAGLAARATAGPEGPRVFWTTAAHEGLLGWAVFREEVLSDGRIARTGPEILPTSDRAQEPFRYAYLDGAARPGTFYRYTIWAVTEAGLLARAFSATLRTAD